MALLVFPARYDASNCAGPARQERLHRCFALQEGKVGHLPPVTNEPPGLLALFGSQSKSLLAQDDPQDG